MAIDRDKKFKMRVEMEVTAAQALALTSMFDYWNALVNQGSSRIVGMYIDGDGDFRPNLQYYIEDAGELPELTPELREAAVIQEHDGDRVYDYDPIAWRIYHDE